MKKKLLFILLTCFTIVSTFSQTFDQYNTGPLGLTLLAFVNNDIGQSFNAGLTSALSKFSFYIDTPTTGSSNCQLKIYSRAGNGGVLLGTQSFSVASTTPVGEFEIPISSTINSTAGMTYTAYISIISGESLDVGSITSSYVLGDDYFNITQITSHDLYFITYVTLAAPATHLNFDGVDDKVDW